MRSRHDALGTNTLGISGGELLGTANETLANPLSLGSGSVTPSFSNSGFVGGPGEAEISRGTVKAGDANAGELLQDPIVDAGATLDVDGFNVDLQGSGTVTDSGGPATLTLDEGGNIDAFFLLGRPVDFVEFHEPGGFKWRIRHG
jgi:hypothetical protein